MQQVELLSERILDSLKDIGEVVHHVDVGEFAGLDQSREDTVGFTAKEDSGVEPVALVGRSRHDGVLATGKRLYAQGLRQAN
jgi:hypothetical protein